MGIGLGHRRSGREAGLGELQRDDDLVADHVLDLSSRDLLDDDAEEDVVGVAVAHLFARREFRLVPLTIAITSSGENGISGSAVKSARNFLSLVKSKMPDRMPRSWRMVILVAVRDALDQRSRAYRRA